MLPNFDQSYDSMFDAVLLKMTQAVNEFCLHQFFTSTQCTMFLFTIVLPKTNKIQDIVLFRLHYGVSVYLLLLGDVVCGRKKNAITERSEQLATER
mmetsp:Transcript_17122/g.41033  ORF Transcript_17122/g.41033 Transcript_17122/m.41033 type:complete len:96 (+) Transcript_17122:863-1150(+)